MVVDNKNDILNHFGFTSGKYLPWLCNDTGIADDEIARAGARSRYPESPVIPAMVEIVRANGVEVGVSWLDKVSELPGTREGVIGIPLRSTDGVYNPPSS